jgi:acetolactate synthase-1/2/3 large subunit
MLGRPAATLLHLGPGFANGIANLHNARRARTSILNLVGDHATWHLPFDAPLTSDIRSLATPVSGYYGYIDKPADCLPKLSEAMRVALTGCVSTLVIPTDVQEGAVAPGTSWQPSSKGAGPTFSSDKVEAAARSIMVCTGSIIILGSGALTAAGQNAAQAIAAATGSRVFAETFPARWDRGAAIPTVPRFPYFPEQGLAILKGAPLVLLVGTKAPVAYFGTAGLPSQLAPAGTIFSLATPLEDAEGAILALAKALDVAQLPQRAPDRALMPAASDRLDPQTMAQTVAALLPDDAIVVVEGATTTPFFFGASLGSATHTVMTNTGGAIGQGMPVATGAALACPNRPVVNLQADGSGAYTLQSLWTQAREGLNVVTVLCANRAYGILRVEFERAKIDKTSAVADRMTSLDNPPLDWVSLAKGFGVPAARANTVGELAELLRRALASDGPFLIEAAMW